MTQPEPPHPHPEWRVGDAERTHACQTLSAHHALGRLTPSELDERLGAAVAAVTRRDLDRLLCDLPPLGGDQSLNPAQPFRAGRPSSTQAPPRPPGLLRESLEAVLLLGAIGSVLMVGLMLLGSSLLGPQTFAFSLVGGSLTLFFTAVITRATCRSGAARPQRAQGAQQLQP